MAKEITCPICSCSSWAWKSEERQWQCQICEFTANDGDAEKKEGK